jgi:hypothetical protein
MHFGHSLARGVRTEFNTSLLDAEADHFNPVEVSGSEIEP